MRKPIFNSLGSNYSGNMVALALRQLLFPLDKSAALTDAILQRFGGEKVVLTYKGRDAIELALRGVGVGSGDQVVTQAFACYAIEEGILRTGAKPVYVDVAAGTSNLDPEQLSALNNKKIKAVIVQHSLGAPAEIQAIADWCADNNVTLIEDVAQAIGGSGYGKPLGAYGDVVVFSFGRDKIVDAVSGGAVLFHQAPDQKLPRLNFPDRALVQRDLWYPIITWLIRTGHSWGWGKAVFVIAKKLGWLWSPIEAVTDRATALPKALTPLVLRQWQQIDRDVAHRQEIGAYYRQHLDIPGSTFVENEHAPDGSNQRVLVKLDEPEALIPLIAYLKRCNIHLSDRWYRQPVDCGSLSCTSVYTSGTAPQAEALAASTINLPTHQGITTTEAQRIIDCIQEFMEDQHGNHRS